MDLGPQENVFTNAMLCKPPGSLLLLIILFISLSLLLLLLLLLSLFLHIT